jgi:conjugal transfer pilus assembly protein TraU
MIFTIASACSSVNFLLSSSLIILCVSKVICIKLKYINNLFYDKIKLLLLQAVITIFIFKPAFSACNGNFVNPVTDICWECFFPMTIGSMPVMPGKAPDTNNFSSPVCVCPKGGVPLPGISMGLWEPIGMVDVVKEPMCFANLGGMKLNLGISKVGTGTQYTPDDTQKHSFHYVHYYKYPVTAIINIVLEAACLEVSGFDVAYISELDPIWNNEALAIIQNPEAILFGNVVAQASCSADCIKTSGGVPFDSLFWCAGCHGGMYPFTGRGVQFNMVQNSVLMAEKTLAKMHRQLQLFNTSGPESICQPTPSPIIKKSQYRTQIVNPVSATNASLGCNPLGRSTILYESGRIKPSIGEEFGYLIWRKRNCCVL